MLLIEEIRPSLVKDGGFHRQVSSAHMNQTLEPTLDVTVDQKAPSRSGCTARSIHHFDPGGGHVPELAAFVDSASACVVKLCFESRPLHLHIAFWMCGLTRLETASTTHLSTAGTAHRTQLAPHSG